MRSTFLLLSMLQISSIVSIIVENISEASEIWIDDNITYNVAF